MSVKKCKAALVTQELDGTLVFTTPSASIVEDQIDATLPTGAVITEVGLSSWDKIVAEFGHGYTLPKPTNNASVSLGDDGWVEANILGQYRGQEVGKAVNSLVDYTTLAYPNVFGNTLRFTGTTGTASFVNSYVIDHISGLGYYPTSISVPTATSATAIIDGLGTDFGGNNSALGYTDWFMCNLHQLYDVKDKNYNKPLSYPFYAFFANGDLINTSTREPGNTVDFNQIGWRNVVAHNSDTARKYIVCRKHF